MKKNLNIECDNLRQNILDMVNESNLPIAIVYYIFKDIFNEMEKSYIAYINGIRLQQNEEAKKKVEQLKEKTI